MDGKKAIILLVLLALVFVVVIATSSGKDDDKNAELGDSKDRSLVSLFNHFVKEPRSVTASEAGGTADFVILSGQTQSISIRPATDVRIRTLKILRTHGSNLELRFVTKGEHKMDVPAKLKDKPDIKFQVFEEGATLFAKCVGPEPGRNTCGLQLQK